MKSIKEIIKSALRMFRMELLKSTPTQDDTTHALSCAGAYKMRTNVYQRNYPTGTIGAGLDAELAIRIPEEHYKDSRYLVFLDARSEYAKFEIGAIRDPNEEEQDGYKKFLARIRNLTNKSTSDTIYVTYMLVGTIPDSGVTPDSGSDGIVISGL